MRWWWEKGRFCSCRDCVLSWRADHNRALVLHWLCSGEQIHETVCEKQKSWVQMGPGGFEGSGVGGMSSSQMSLWAAAVVHALCCSTDKVAKIMDAKRMNVFLFSPSLKKKMMKQRPTVSLVKRKCQRCCCGVNKLALLSSYLGGETHPRPHQTTRLRFLSELHNANIFSCGFMCLVASPSAAYGNLMSHLFTLCSVVLDPPGFNMPHTVHIGIYIYPHSTYCTYCVKVLRSLI